MTRSLPLLPSADFAPSASRSIADDEPGFGAMRTEKGQLPLQSMEVDARIDGLLSRVVVRQTFVNACDEPVEAAYIFPLPDRAAVTGFRMTVAGREIAGLLEERGQARERYDEAIAQGRRAAIAEEDRPGVFNLRVGNLMPGERAVVELTLCGVLPYVDGEVTFRFPLVVAPRYIPGMPLPGPSSGDGTAVDTNTVPDASRITPPVLLPGFPNPVRLRLAVELHDHGADLATVRSSLHAVQEDVLDGYRRIRVDPGERLDRDFILRFRLGGKDILSTLTLHPDADRGEGTFALTVVPPSSPSDAEVRPRDVVFILDRSGSMEGWKMVTARRAVARMIDTLGDADRFCVLAFDTTVETPPTLEDGLVAATDRNRFRAVEYLARVEARGGTELVEPLEKAVRLLGPSRADEGRRILVLITDGQVANEDQVLKRLGTRLRGTRVFTIGIDRAVNEGFLRRLAERGGGSCELVESEDRLDAVMANVHRRIGTPLLTGLNLAPDGLEIEPGEVVPRRLPDLFAGSPLLIMGRYRGRPEGSIAIRGIDATGKPHEERVPIAVRENPAIAAAWARGQIRQLEDRYAAGDGDRPALEKAIVAISLGYRVLCRFTAYVAVDRSQAVNPGVSLHRITQSVEMPQGWGEMGRVAWASMPPPSVAAPRAASGGGTPRAWTYGSGLGGGARRLSSSEADALPPSPAFFAHPSIADFEGSIPVPPSDALETYGDAGGGARLQGGMPVSADFARSLAYRLLTGPRMTDGEAASLIAEVAEVLQRLHDQNRVHGALEPSNIRLDVDGHPSLPDVSPGVARTVLTYAAPEKIGSPGSPPDQRVDVYALGAILYEVLTGQVPFKGGREIIQKALGGSVIPPRQIIRTIPARLEAICLKAMAKEPSSRYATAGEMAAALRDFLKPRRKPFWK